MKTIKSNNILESFGMKNLKLEELMEIDAGCGIRFGCSNKSPVCTPNIPSCPVRIVECPTNGVICSMKMY